jgi:hypothetical protein
MHLYADTLGFLHGVTQLLNAAPDSKDFYLDVRLREQETHRVMGWWSDEISTDCWAFVPGDPDAQP